MNRNLRKLRLEIYEALDEEENYTVFLYISDELEDPIKFVNGSGDNELVINIESDGIRYAWTRVTFWKKTKDFFQATASKIIEALRNVWKAGGLFIEDASKSNKLPWNWNCCPKDT